MLGQARAQAEVEEVLRVGRYAWLDDLRAAVALPLPDPKRIRRLAAELATNCCRESTIECLLEQRLGRLRLGEGTPWRSGEQTVASYLRRCDGKLRWSKLAEQFIAFDHQVELATRILHPSR